VHADKVGAKSPINKLEKQRHILYYSTPVQSRTVTARRHKVVCWFSSLTTAGC